MKKSCRRAAVGTFCLDSTLGERASLVTIRDAREVCTGNAEASDGLRPLEVRVFKDIHGKSARATQKQS
jgi:hypothetical protein